MSIEEAIDILQGIKDGTACLMKDMPRRGEIAIDMAIDALKQPEPCEDAVSRQAAIDACGGYLVPAQIIANLPTVTPKQRTGKWIPSDSQCGIQCSVCGVPIDDFCHSIDYIDLDYKPNFCPNCGWAMKGDTK